MPCPHCCSAQTTERSDRTAHGYRRFRCRGCGRGFNERTGSVLNRFQLPTDVVFLIVLWRLWMKLSLRDLTEILLLRGLVFSHEAIRDWEARLAPLLTDALRRRRKGKAGRTALLNLKQCCADVRAFEIRTLASSIEKQLVLDAFMQI
jgi:putative transposase